jgi:hypothetical protein
MALFTAIVASRLALAVCVAEAGAVRGVGRGGLDEPRAEAGGPEIALTLPMGSSARGNARSGVCASQGGAGMIRLVGFLGASLCAGEPLAVAGDREESWGLRSASPSACILGKRPYP